MDERYSKLFTLPPNLYAEGAPVIIAAGNLLKDNATGNILVQLKIRNLEVAAIKAASVRIRAMDTAGKPIDGDAEQEYLDLLVRQGGEFGQKVAVKLPNPSTRGFVAEVQQVVFTDNSIWEWAGEPWEPLPAGTSLHLALGDEELEKQYRLKFGGKCDTVFQEHKDLWLCACGTWNRFGKCYCCGKTRTALRSLDIDALNEEKNERLAREKAEREAKEAAAKAARDESVKKAKKIITIAILAVVICIAALLIVTKAVIPSVNYRKARALLDAGRYQEAIAAFEALNGYKDSAAQITKARKAKADEDRLAYEARIAAETEAAYLQACKLLEDGDYIRARDAFLTLGDYKDSAKKAEEVVEQFYVQAKNLAESGNYYEAATAFFKIQEYKDSWQRSFDLWGLITQRRTFDVDSCIVAVRNNGTVVSEGRNYHGAREVSGWKNIVAISTSGHHTVGLRADGTVVVAGNYDYGECSIDHWKNIVAIATGDNFTLGLRMDGTVIGDAGISYSDYSDTIKWWKDIIAIDAASGEAIGLCKNGSVVTTRKNSPMSGWSNVIAVSAGGDNNMGVTADGSVLSDRGPNVTDHDVVDVSANVYYTALLHKNGTVTLAGKLSSLGEGANSIHWGNWNNIIDIGSQIGIVVGLTADGEMVAYGDQPDTDIAAICAWSDIKIPQNINIRR